MSVDDVRGEDYEAAKPRAMRLPDGYDPFAPRDPFDDTPQVERDLKGWIASYYRAKNPNLGRNSA